MSSVKREIENGITTVKTSRIIILIFLLIGIGALLLGISLGGLFF